MTEIRLFSEIRLFHLLIQMESPRTTRCISVLSVHLLLSIVCLSIGFFSPFYFGLYDQCDFIEPERTFSGWSIHRDLSDLYGAVILLGFVFLGVSFGIIGKVLYTCINWHGIVFKSPRRHSTCVWL